MKINRLNATVIIVSLMMCYSCFAERIKEANLLTRMVGEWDVIYIMEWMGSEGKGEGIMKSQKTANNNSIVIDYKNTNGPMKEFAMLEILSWNENNNELDISWVDSFNSGIRTHHAKRNGDVFIYTSENMRNEKIIYNQSMITNIEENSFQVKSLSGSEKKNLSPNMTLYFTRKKSN